MLVYLGGAIDDATREEAQGWRDQAKAALAKEGITCYDPCAAFSAPVDHPEFDLRDIGKRAHFIEREVIARSTALLVNLIPGKPFGTIREIDFARSLDRPVVVVAENLPSLQAWDLIIVPDLESGIRGIISGSWRQRRNAPHPEPTIGSSPQFRGA